MKLSQLSEPAQRMWAWEIWFFFSSALSWCGWGRDAPLTAYRWWERWSCGHMSWRATPGPYQLTAALGRMAPAPCLGITVELAMMVQGWERWHWDLESRRTGPTPARWCDDRGELVRWPTLQLYRPRSKVMGWPTAISTPSMTYRCTWRDWSCRPKTAGTPGHMATEYPRRLPVKIKHW